MHDGERVRPLEGHAARQHLSRDDAEGPRSLRASTSPPVACSGDMYAAVPMVVPALVSRAIVSVSVDDEHRDAEVEHLHMSRRR